MSTSVRPAVVDDVPLILSLIRGLAEYEKLSDQCVATEDALRASLFGERPAAEVLIGEIDARPMGFALYFTNYSTFLAKPGIYLEDLFVRPEARGRGLGKALIMAVIDTARRRGCGRVEWSVLDWNEPSIAFYKSLGAVPMDEWTIYRMVL